MPKDCSKREKNLHLFDNLTFIDGTTEYGQIVALYISASGNHAINHPFPEWFENNFLQSFQDIVNKDLERENKD